MLTCRPLNVLVWPFLDFILLKLLFSADASDALKGARQDGYDFVTTSLPSSATPRPDVTAMQGRWWRTSVVGKVEPVVEGSNSAAAGADDEVSFSTVMEQLPFQLEWASHMGIPAVIAPLPPAPSILDYAQLMQTQALAGQANNLQIWIPVPLTEQAIVDFEILHRLMESPVNVGMMLVLEPLPTLATAAASVAAQLILLHKAIGANLKCISVNTSVFLTNKKGYPTLAKSHQVLLTHALKRVGRTVRILVEGPAMHHAIQDQAGKGVTNCLPYVQYLRHLRTRPECSEFLDSEEAILETPYLDSLQRPLQPLKDHLEFGMYETFEKDPVKYAKYQQAVYLALEDGLSSLTESGAPPGGVEKRQITIAVAGSGRGPLVQRCIQAFHVLVAPGNPYNLVLKVFAIEKNPSAVVYLNTLAATHKDWIDVVTVVEADARNITLEDTGGVQIDIIVSELLGSFGDNELSPECLEPLLASACCKPSTISIPEQYSSYISPVSSIRLHSDAKLQSQIPHEGNMALGMQRAMETPYVVRTHAASQTHAEQKCWTFQHPEQGGTSMERAAMCEFAPDPTLAAAAGSGYGPIDLPIQGIVGQTPSVVAGSYTVHGLLGTFTAILYASKKDATKFSEISIAPHRFSKGMFSWFPLYFPFKDSLSVPTGSNVAVRIWRKCKGNQVWYEWCAQVHRKGEILSSTPIHNPGGRSSNVSMSF